MLLGRPEKQCSRGSTAGEDGRSRAGRELDPIGKRAFELEVYAAQESDAARIT